VFFVTSLLLLLVVVVVFSPGTTAFTDDTEPGVEIDDDADAGADREDEDRLCKGMWSVS
jgi:hypothetical protein